VYEIHETPGSDGACRHVVASHHRTPDRRRSVVVVGTVPTKSRVAGPTGDLVGSRRRRVTRCSPACFAR
jgi:hypothetical protein